MFINNRSANNTFREVILKHANIYTRSTIEPTNIVRLYVEQRSIYCMVFLFLMKQFRLIGQKYVKIYLFGHNSVDKQKNLWIKINKNAIYCIFHNISTFSTEKSLIFC